MLTRVAWMVALALLLLPTGRPVRAQQAVKPYIHVIVDTSPSMANAAGCSGCGSRMEEVVAALRDIISGVSEVTFGLQSFLDRESCIGAFCFGCNNVSCAAGDVLVPFSDGNQAELYSWVDGVCSDTDDSNLELLPWGNPTVPNTPIAANLSGAVAHMSTVIAADDKNTCRPYVVVFLTDGEENCGNSNCSGSVTARNNLGNISVPDRPAGCTVPTYMIGLPGANLACLDAIQDAPSTGRDQAIEATDRTELALAFQRIVADSVLVEVCDEQEDEDCDGVVDEGFQLYCDLPSGVTDNVLCNDPGDPCDGVDDNCYAGIDDEVRNACGTCGDAPDEECDELDNDCDGFIDEGIDCGNPCEPTGPEVCNGLDDDCDGLVDEDDPMAGSECGSAEGTCEPGRLRCINGELQCVGATGPRPEVCDGLDNDCNAEVDDDAECPPRTACIEAACRPPCDPDEEFPCPVGFSCVEHTDGDFYCLPAACDDCGPGERCVDRGCQDLCEGVECTGDETCVAGECVGCARGGCPDGEICVEQRCEADPCADVTCADDEACRDGDCRTPCADEDCEEGERCRDDWTCGEDPCAGVECGQGEACLDGDCIEDGCVNSACSPVDVCVLGRGCVPDPCLTVRCPAGNCVVSRDGVPACDTEPVDDDMDDDGDDEGAADAAQDRVIASGGGGFTCRAAGTGGGAVWPVWFALLALWRRRRR